MPFNLSYTIICTANDVTVTFLDSCDGDPLAGIPVSVTFVPTGDAIASGSSGGDGTFTFKKTCGIHGAYHIVYGAKECWAGGAFNFGPTTCAPEKIGGGSSALPGLGCCPGFGLYPTPIFITDSLGSSDITGGAASISGSRDHVDDTCTNQPQGKWEVDGLPGDWGCFCEIVCDEAYTMCIESVYTKNSGIAATTYFLTCGRDEGGTYFQLGATWNSNYCTESHFNHSLFSWCRHLIPPWDTWWCLGFQTMNPDWNPLCTIYDCRDYPVIGTVTKGADCSFTTMMFSKPATCTGHYYYSTLGAPNAGASSAKQYMGKSPCNPSLSLAFTLLPPPGVTWTYDGPTVEPWDGIGQPGACGPSDAFSTPPPGGISVIITS